MILFGKVIFIAAVGLALLSPSALPSCSAQTAVLQSTSSKCLARHLYEACASGLQSNTEAASRLLTQSIQLSPNSNEANLALAKVMLDGHHYPEAMERFETVLALDHASAPARQGELAAANAIALEYRRAGNQEAALNCLRHARHALPDDPTLLHHLGIQLFEMRQLAAAAEALRQAVALAPYDPDNLYALARVEVEQQTFPAAEQHFHTYLAARPNDASAHYGLGHLLQMQQRNDEAAVQFNQSLKLQPVQTESYYQLGQMALDEHRDEAARPLFERTLSRAPNHGGALTGLGILAYRSTDYSAAAFSLRKAIIASPDYQPAHYYLGLALARLNDKEASTQELKRAADLAAKQQGRSSRISSQPLP